MITKTLDFTDTNGVERSTLVKIVAFGHDDLSDGNGKASITVLGTEATFLSSAMDSSNVSTLHEFLYDWETCDIRAKLNTSVFASLPEALKSGIKSVKKQTTKYVNGTDATGITKSDDKIWIPSSGELGAKTSNYSISGNDGTKYDSIDYRSIMVNSTDYPHYMFRTGSYKYKYSLGGYRQDASKSFTSINVTNTTRIVFGFCI